MIKKIIDFMGGVLKRKNTQYIPGWQCLIYPRLMELFQRLPLGAEVTLVGGFDDSLLLIRVDCPTYDYHNSIGIPKKWWDKNEYGKIDTAINEGINRAWGVVEVG